MTDYRSAALAGRLNELGTQVLIPANGYDRSDDYRPVTTVDVAACLDALNMALVPTEALAKLDAFTAAFDTNEARPAMILEAQETPQRAPLSYNEICMLIILALIIGGTILGITALVTT